MKFRSNYKIPNVSRRSSTRERISPVHFVLFPLVAALDWSGRNFERLLSVEGSNREEEDLPSARKKPEGVARACATIFRTSIGERTPFSRCDAFVNGARPPRASHPFGVARRVFISTTQVSICTPSHVCTRTIWSSRNFIDRFRNPVSLRILQFSILRGWN